MCANFAEVYFLDVNTIPYVIKETIKLINNIIITIVYSIANDTFFSGKLDLLVWLPKSFTRFQRYEESLLSDIAFAKSCLKIFVLGVLIDNADICSLAIFFSWDWDSCCWWLL